jgi:hypothetical protein
MPAAADAQVERIVEAGIEMTERHAARASRRCRWTRALPPLTFQASRVCPWS